MMQDGARTVIVHERAAVGVDASGTITRFDPEFSCDADKADEAAAVRRLGPTQFLVPGLVDAHIHAPQFAYAGTATDVPLLKWLEVGGRLAQGREGKGGDAMRWWSGPTGQAGRQGSVVTVRRVCDVCVRGPPTNAN